MKHPITVLALLAALTGHVPSRAGEVPLSGENGKSTGSDDPWRLPRDKQDFHIFLLMGQSNMAGGIKGDQLLPEDRKPEPHVVYIPTQARSFAWKPAAHPLHVRKKRPNGFGLGLPFARRYLEFHPGATVGLIPVAYGGHRIDLLNKGSKVYDDAMKKAAFAATRGTIKGVLWHHGESDTVNNDRADSYEKKLLAMVADVRTDLGIADLPFLVGDLGQLYGIGEGREPDPDKLARVAKVRNALRSLPRKLKRTAFVETTGLTYSDAPKCTHFDRQSYITLGHRYADAYEQMFGAPAEPLQQRSNPAP